MTSAMREAQESAREAGRYQVVSGDARVGDAVRQVIAALEPLPHNVREWVLRSAQAYPFTRAMAAPAAAFEAE